MNTKLCIFLMLLFVVGCSKGDQEPIPQTEYEKDYYERGYKFGYSYVKGLDSQQINERDKKFYIFGIKKGLEEASGALKEENNNSNNSKAETSDEQAVEETEYSFASFKMEYETGMKIGKEYIVHAYLDPSGLYVCDLNNSGRLSGGSCGNLGLGVVYVHNSFDKDKGKELYKLRGSEVCLKTMIAGGEIWIRSFAHGKCKQ